MENQKVPNFYSNAGQMQHEPVMDKGFQAEMVSRARVVESRSESSEVMNFVMMIQKEQADQENLLMELRARISLVVAPQNEKVSNAAPTVAVETELGSAMRNIFENVEAGNNFIRELIRHIRL